MSAVEMISSEMDAMTAHSGSRSLLSLVVATDGSKAAEAAFKAAVLIEKKTGCRVHVVSVLEPIPLLLPIPDGVVVPPEVQAKRGEAMEAAMQRQTREFDRAGLWDSRMLTGRPADEIANFARVHGAGLVIVGSNRHGVWDRVMGEETALHLARMVDVPLLVASDMTRLPTRVMVAMDIKPSGLEQMPSALSAVTGSNSISCVHVKPRAEFMGLDWAEFDREYDAAVGERFREMERLLGQSGCRPDLIVRHGDVTHELVEFAKYSKAELVVVGINHRGGRLLRGGGRLAGRLLRQLTASVLIVPGAPHLAGQSAAEGATDVLTDSLLWGNAMKSFTARNAGRICTLEVDDPDLGALVEARSYPLLGVDYDHKDRRLTIMLGELTGAEKHLARSISEPESIAVLSSGARDKALSIKHGSGQTLLTF